MENRKNLHDYSLVLIFLAFLDVFNYVATVISAIVDGTVAKALENVEADILVPVKVGLILVSVVLAVATFGEGFIGVKGLKVSRQPCAHKGYIVAAKVFFVLSIVATVVTFAGFFNAKASIVDTALSFVCFALDIVLYILFIKNANAVRADFLAEKK